MHDLLQLMYQDGALSSTELVALRKTCRNLRENPVRVLRSLNIASPAEIQALLQKFFGISAITDEVIDALDENFKALIPTDIALNYSVFAVAEEDGKVYVAMEDPTDKGTIHQLEFFLGRQIIPVVASSFQLASGICKLYGVDISELKLSTVLESSRGVVGGFVPRALQTEDVHEAEIETALIADDANDSFFNSGSLMADEVNSEDTSDANVPSGLDFGETATAGELSAMVPGEYAFEEDGIDGVDSQDGQPLAEVDSGAMALLQSFSSEETPEATDLISAGMGEPADMGDASEPNLRSDSFGMDLEGEGTTLNEEDPAEMLMANGEGEQEGDDEGGDEGGDQGEDEFSAVESVTEASAHGESVGGSEAGDDLESLSDLGDMASFEEAESPDSAFEEVQLTESESDGFALDESDDVEDLPEGESLLLVPQEMHSEELPEERCEEKLGPQGEPNEEFLRSLSGLVSGALVKISLAKDSSQALDILNTKLVGLDVAVVTTTIDHLALVFEITCPYGVFRYEAQSAAGVAKKCDVPVESPILEALRPALKKIARFAA